MAADPAKIIAQSTTSHVDPTLFDVQVDPSIAQQLAAVDPAELAAVTVSLQRLLEQEASIFDDASASLGDIERQLAQGFSELLSQQLPDPPSDLVVPPIMERTKRPLNHQKFQKDILQEWLFAHVDNPYPTDLEKADLAARTGLPIRQVSTWLQNARTRLLPKIREGKLKLSDLTSNKKKKTED